MGSCLVVLFAAITALSFVSCEKVVFGDGEGLAAARAIRHKRQTTLPTSVLSDSNKAEILEAHLSIRETAGASAGNLLKMEYSESLASLAQLTTDTCQFTNANLYHVDVGDVGQVIFRSSGSSLPGPPLEAMAAEESAAYDFATNTCQTGQTCSNYKQIVWYTTDKVGCGKKFCPLLFLPDGTMEFSQWFWVCNYQDLGAFDDERPYLESNKPCSLCNLDPGTLCERNQCVTCDPDTNVACRRTNSTLCVANKDSCCSSWDSATYCDPASDRFGYMRENCAGDCGIYLCGA